MPVNIEWVGHACFRVWPDAGLVVVMDPYTPSEVGVADENGIIDGDVVLLSSLDDRAHSNPKLVRGNPSIIDALELAETGRPAEIEGNPVVAVGAAESPIHDSGSPKDNALYALQLGGTWVMHMGDLGYGLTPQELAPFEGRCEVLLAIVGQFNTISLEDLDTMIEQLRPKWIVPMHYALPPIAGNMRPLGEFLDRRATDPVIYARSSQVQFPLDFPDSDRPVIVVLKPSGYEPVE